MTPDSLAKLLTVDAWELLGALPPYDSATAHAQLQELRKAGIEPDLAAAMMTQSRLRAAAVAKFGSFAQGLLLSQDGLEQATRLIVGALHARRYKAAGCTHIADITCGIGADSLAFAAAGLDVLATDIDEVTATMATVNLRHFPQARVRHMDGLTVDLLAEGIDGVFADPARRTAGKRIFDPNHYAPPLDAVWDLRRAVPALGIKVGPGIPHQGLPADAQVQWVSVDGDVVEAGLWFGPLAQDGPGRSAAIVTTSSTADGQVVTGMREMQQDGPDGAQVNTGPLGDYLYEPDGAIIRAGLVAEAAQELGGVLIDPTIAYITSDSLGAAVPGHSGGSELESTSDAAAAGAGIGAGKKPAAPIATGYRVLDVIPLKVKLLKAYLRERNVGRVTIKKRGTSITPEQLRPQLALHGSQEATVVLTRIAGQHSAIIVEPLP